MQAISSPIAGCMRWGSWGSNFSTYDYQQMIESCLQAGIHSFDHADIYGHYTTEAEFGAVIKSSPAIRENIKIITKCGIKLVAPTRAGHIIKSYDTSYHHIIASVNQSLENFHTDYIDVLLIHRPDPLLNPSEVARAVHDLKKAGKILQFGVSNFLPHQVNMLQKFITLEYNQVEISIMQMAALHNGVLENCLEHGIIPMAWAPLGGGLITDDLDEKNIRIASAAKLVAEKYNTGINQVLIAWLHTHPARIIPVVGSTKIERLQQAKEAEDLQLTREEWFILWRAATGDDVP
ncbi:aldo/keto reductase [Aridibaculum aurantiacum]|uniref:aldo/keto reductase n=1 Tax=Aridibaculum aurantiacum TaxID=2810307 RepID=UPI001A9698BD|nr:aldo/keto reductase [Aridibaculum aurantiacum]